MRRNNKRQYLKAALAVVTALVLCMGYMPLQTYAAAEETDQSDPFAFQSGKALRALEKEAASYPDSFDLRNVDTDGDGEGDKSFITPVKVQNPYASCWGFAAVSAAESSLIAAGLADESIDLSEKQVAFFATSYIDDPSNPQNGEGMYFYGLTDKDRKTSAYRYQTGGSTMFATSLFASGTGPVLEDAKDPDTGESLADILEYKGAREEKVVNRVAISYDEDGNPVDYARKAVWYSLDDDWSIPEKYRYIRSYSLKDSIILPTPAYNHEDPDPDQLKIALDALKQQMYEHHRAISINFCAESYLPGQDTSGKKYMSSNWAHYTSEGEFPNHAVTIVGWDDNYPKENFLTQPDGDGAFLIKNSWGSELNDFPNNGYRHWGLLEGQDTIPYDENARAVSDRATGYFWLSYYDESLVDPEAFIFVKADGEEDYEIAQMDQVHTLSIDNYISEGCRSANVFTAAETSELKDISVMTTTPGTEVSYEVYMLPEGFDDPESGEKIAEGRENFDYGGYHRISLSTPKVLAKDQKYSVVVSEKAEDAEYVAFRSQYNSPMPSGNEKTYCKVIVNKGESFCFHDGHWADITDKAAQEEIAGSEYEEVDNFPIKAYLKPVFDGYLTINNWHEGTPGSFRLFTEHSKTVTAEFRGLSGGVPDGWDPVITWRSSDESVVKVIEKGDHGEGAVLEAGDEGKAYITIDAGGYGTRVIGITVSKPAVESIMFEDFIDEFEYTGKEIRPAVGTVWVEMEDDEEVPELVQDVDYTVGYKKNIKPGTAYVIVKGIGKYKGTVKEPFTILKAANPMTASGKTVKLKASDLRKKNKTVDRSKAYTVKSEEGKLTYSKVSVSSKKYAKKFTVNKKTGKITVKKGLKKGKYTVTVKIKAAGNDCYKSKTKKVKVTIKVN